MLIYKCDYCGAEYEFDGVGRVCPKCGASIETTSDKTPESLAAIAAEPIKVQLTEPLVIEATTGKVNRHNKGSVAKAVLITVIVMVIAFFAFCIIIATIPYDDDSPAAAYDYTYYTEEGHLPGDPYTGAMKLSFDLSNYEMVSWTDEPTITWGTPGYSYSAEKLTIHGRIHNNTGSMMDVDLKYDLIGTDGSVLTYGYITVYDLLENQDSLIEETLYVYLPVTYDQISEIRLTNCSITIE
jgi:hypothetical protein